MAGPCSTRWQPPAKNHQIWLRLWHFRFLSLVWLALTCAARFLQLKTKTTQIWMVCHLSGASTQRNSGMWIFSWNPRGAVDRIFRTSTQSCWSYIDSLGWTVALMGSGRKWRDGCLCFSVGWCSTVAAVSGKQNPMCLKQVGWWDCTLCGCTLRHPSGGLRSPGATSRSVLPGLHCYLPTKHLFLL